MSCFIIVDKNFSDPDNCASASFSSEQTAFPSENVFDFNRRRKVWRSNGYWNIDSGSNTIIFYETAATPLTATVTAGTYASDTLFFAALKAALEDAGASVYTITRDTTTNRIKITSDHSGGGGIFSLIWTDAGSEDMAGILGYDIVSNDTGAFTYTAQELRIHTSEWILWDMGFPVNPKVFLGVADRNRSLKISPNATITLKGNYVDEWTTPQVTVNVEVSDYAIGATNEDGFAGASSYGYRYWRLEIIDPSSVFGYAELGAVVLGSPTDLTRGCPTHPLEVVDEDLSLVAYSEGGTAITGRKQKTEGFTLNWEGLDKGSLETLQSVFNQFGTHTSFFMVMDADLVYSTSVLAWARLVKFRGAPRKRLVKFNNWNYTWDLREDL